MDVSSWLEQLSMAYASFGAVLGESTRRLLIAGASEARSEPHIQVVAEASEIMMAFLFLKARNNETFGDVARVKERFGRTLEENYGVVPGPFLSLARAYWTFKLELEDLLSHQSRPLLTEILRRVEVDVASVFFPTPGFLSIPVAKRRAAQRAILQQYAPGFDVERFLAESPILQIEAQRQRPGCLGLVLAVLLGCVVVIEVAASFRV
jgi:hypothetical protein